MDIFVLDNNFRASGVVSDYSSLIWTERYWEIGEFELITSTDYFETLVMGHYLRIEPSAYFMVIESKSVKDGVLTVKGRALESILDRRVIRDVPDSGNAYSVAKTIFDHALSSQATVAANQVPQIATAIGSWNVNPFGDSFTLPAIGTYLSDAIVSLAKYASGGFRFELETPDNEDTFALKFRLFMGVDRSGTTSTVETVTFSEANNNLSGSEYIQDISKIKTVAIVHLEASGSQTSRNLEVQSGVYSGYSGLNRRELWSEGSSIRTNSDYDSANEDALAESKGTIDLSDHEIQTSFDTEIVPDSLINSNKKYSVGDIVLAHTEYGVTGKFRVIEHIISSSKSDGDRTYPTLALITSEGA